MGYSCVEEDCLFLLDGNNNNNPGYINGRSDKRNQKANDR